MLPQYKAPAKFNLENIKAGSLQFIWGAFKKLVVADRIAVLVNTVYANPSGHSAFQLLTAAVCYSVQIYCDFSAYSDMGIITIQDALTNSINTVSAQILDKLTPSVAYSYLTSRLGATSAVQADCDYAPLALGQLTKGITVREMAQAYDSFVNDGVFTAARTYTQVKDSQGNIVLDNTPKTKVAFKANTAWTMDYMTFS